MYWENQPELPSDKGSNWLRGATRDIGSPPLWWCGRIHVYKKLYQKYPVNLQTLKEKKQRSTPKHSVRLSYVIFSLCLQRYKSSKMVIVYSLLRISLISSISQIKHWFFFYFGNGDRHVFLPKKTHVVGKT